MLRKINTCRICGNSELAPILNLGEQFLTGVFPKDPSQTISRGPLELVKCHGPEHCGLLQLSHSFDSAEMYGANYGYRSSLNQSMVEHLRHKINGLLHKYPLPKNAIVLDIGSNDGTLLSFYPSTVRRIGMDPTATKFLSFYQAGIEAIPEFFSRSAFSALAGQDKASIITSIAMFYDLEDPLAFVQNVRECLSDDGIWHFEQSYMPTMLNQNAYDTICHEHLEYYSLRQIDWMISRSGMRILDVEINNVNGGSFAVTACKTHAPFHSNRDKISALLALEDLQKLDHLSTFKQFSQRVFQHRDDLRKTVTNINKTGALLLGYGASTKGNVLLQFCEFGVSEIPAIADVNKDKFGAYTPGSKIPILSETEAHALKPDYLLVLPWHFRENLISRETAFLNKGGRMIFPLPEITTHPA
jgi:cyclopropane fatty-acyl-phospholipid synthase-like methyltransferase